MTPRVVELDLPPPPAQIQQQLLHYLNQVALDPDCKTWLDQFHQGQINSAQHLFFPAPDPWQTVIRDLYQQYFPQHTLTVAFGIMTNVATVPACMPPHTDRARGLAINYYLQLGGSEVNTVFYTATAGTKPCEATNYLYTEVGAVVDRKIFQQDWYAYNVNQAHSVENISGTRLVLILVIDHADAAYELLDLIRDYPNLIKQ